MFLPFMSIVTRMRKADDVFRAGIAHLQRNLTANYVIFAPFRTREVSPHYLIFASLLLSFFQ
jgi:hypothetical protein